MNDIDYRIGNSGDAIKLIDELLESAEELGFVSLSVSEAIFKSLRVLKDALERGII
jgi:hypothetical protein